ncbi:LOW QUALITY PROTEIN: protein STRUBBELIG-RECEPTOR FAMILY 3-like [Oryza brachyantha]|uniref:LOW QUALITY PROTEIN: protein STRUBBELIG-RECEPTOR FAMILY 3-like n=1 Tax=Oryza brachyantha TaxID=4533 RepID=UPI001ADA7972|nr:LOW QUALITY PROTEIN: protein STRUBBELIG-RECEPTOR FAMILY 3-like [Oryza brachyantha]
MLSLSFCPPFLPRSFLLRVLASISQPMRSMVQLRLLLVVFVLLASCWLQLLLAFPFPLPFLGPFTSQHDIDAINELYASLGSPDLHGWASSGGDPCMEAWQGVLCLGPNITSIELRGAGLGGKLSETLGKFTAMTTLDLSNNRIGGVIPQSLPAAVTQMDLSSNNINGKLPDSMANLDSLSTLHVQNNQLTGTLDVLGDLPLKDLNVENNLFSGQVPEKLLSIPKFLRNGNHFGIPAIPGSSPTPATPSIPGSHPTPAAAAAAAAPRSGPATNASHPPIYVIPATPQGAARGEPPRHGKKVSPAKAAGFSVLAAGSLTIAVLLVVFAVSRRRRETSHLHGGFLRGVEMSTPDWRGKPPRQEGAVVKADKEQSIVPGEKATKSSISSHQNVQESLRGHPLQFKFRFFTVASLQQYTNSFSEQSLVRQNLFGKIYLAEHQDIKFAVLKLDDAIARMAVDEFLGMVQRISELQHPSIEELAGCCVEHGQRLLVYKHFSDDTLDDMIHLKQQQQQQLVSSDDRVHHGKIALPSWDARVAVALEAAKALEYLHEGGQRQAVHRHFRPEHVLVDGEMRVRVSGCGLAAAAAAKSGSDLQPERCIDALSYEPPEAEAAAAAPWTAKGDVYSFGVVMLQLLTGRRPCDSARPRGERRLVPWASSRLHDLTALEKMADPRLAPAPAPVRSLSRFADIISRCTQEEAEFRPAMSQVVQDLRRTLQSARGAGGEQSCSILLSVAGKKK